MPLPDERRQDSSRNPGRQLMAGGKPVWTESARPGSDEQPTAERDERRPRMRPPLDRTSLMDVLAAQLARRRTGLTITCGARRESNGSSAGHVLSAERCESCCSSPAWWPRLLVRQLARAGAFRWQFPVTRVVESGHRELRCARTDLRYGHHVASSRWRSRSRSLRHRGVHDRNLPALAAHADQYRDRVAGRDSEHRVRHLGPVRRRADPAALRATLADRPSRPVADHRRVVPRRRRTASASLPRESCSRSWCCRSSRR